MKNKISLIEILVIIAMVVILIGAIWGGLSGNVTSNWGRSLTLESVEGGPIQKWHWTDNNTGEKFYSLDANGETLYKESSN